MFEKKELFKFYTDIQEDIKSSLLAEEEGANPEQIFTDIALTMLSDAGETENYRICYDENNLYFLIICYQSKMDQLQIGGKGRDSKNLWKNNCIECRGMRKVFKRGFK